VAADVDRAGPIGSGPGEAQKLLTGAGLTARGSDARERGKVPYRRVKDPKEMLVLFSLHLRKDADEAAYAATSRRMHELVDGWPGFISLKEYTSEDGEVLDIARFADETSLEAWRREPEHLEAQRRGREEFYDRYRIQAARVLRDYSYEIEAKPASPRRAKK
jgi:heme-degrading monooxygenase HmoA